MANIIGITLVARHPNGRPFGDSTALHSVITEVVIASNKLFKCRLKKEHDEKPQENTKKVIKNIKKHY